MPFRLVAVDVDGTLLRRGGVISERTRNALGGAIERGLTLAVATGRRRRSAVYALADLRLPHYLVVSQGAVTWHEDQIIAHSHMPRESARKVLEITRRRQMPCVMFGNAFQPEALWVDGRWEANERLADYLRTGTRGENWTLRRDMTDEALEHDPIQFVVLDTMERLEALNVELTGHAPPPPSVEPPLQEGPAIGRPLWRVIFSKNQFTAGGAIEIVGPETSKAHALGALCERLGYTAQDVVAFGDNVNDLDMLEFAGLGVCMANGTAQAKAAADRVCPSNEEDGIAVTLEELGLA